MRKKTGLVKVATCQFGIAAPPPIPAFASVRTSRLKSKFLAVAVQQLGETINQLQKV